MTDQLSTSLISVALTTRRLGRPALFFPTVGSTNDVIHEHAQSGAAEGLLVVADEQTAGRGRLDRRWWAPAGSSLLMSLLLRPPILPIRAAQLTMCLSLGAVEGIEQVTGLRPQLKWPNDLLLDGRKLGGTLTELRLDGERIVYAVLGLGVNVNVDFDKGQTEENGLSPSALHPPPDVSIAATSLSMALGRSVDRLPLLIAILAACEAWYDRLLVGQSPHEAWAGRLDTMGRPVTVTLPTGSLHGMATGVTAAGALLVRDAQGEMHTVWAGDVMAVR